MEWAKYAHASPSKQYTRNLVCQVPGLFNLLLLVWTPGKKSPVHDHADAHCLMRVLQGELVERRFAFPRFPGMEGKLTETGSAQYREGKVTYMADRLGLHSISNPSLSRYAVSLHRKLKSPSSCWRDAD
jgi:cysteine dioxygenase